MQKRVTKRVAKRVAKRNEPPVLVTTTNRGVFFGYLVGKPGTTVTLRRARSCLYWSEELRGFIGLAASGPSDNCRIGPAADITLYGVTSIVQATKAAAEKWEGAPWKK